MNYTDPKPVSSRLLTIPYCWDMTSESQVVWLIPEFDFICMCHVSFPLLTGGPLLSTHERHLPSLLNRVRSLLRACRIRQAV